MTTRGDQLRLLRRAVLTDVTDRGVSACALKAVLRTIDDHGSTCFLSLETIAWEANVSVRTARRAVQNLAARGLVEVRPGRRCNGYQINWPQLAPLAHQRRTSQGDQLPTSGRPPAPARPATMAGQTVAPTPPTPATLSPVTGHGGRQSDLRSASEAPPTPTPNGRFTRDVRAGPAEEGGEDVCLDGEEAGRWPDVEGELRSLGVKYARSAIRDAQARGATANDALRGIRAWRANRGRLGLGAMVAWLKTGHWPVDAVEAPEDTHQRYQDRERRMRRTREEYLRARKRRGRPDWDPDLEDRFGEELDRLPESALADLVPMGPGRAFLLRQLARSGRRAHILRPMLLQSLEERSA